MCEEAQPSHGHECSDCCERAAEKFESADEATWAPLWYRSTTCSRRCAVQGEKICGQRSPPDDSLGLHHACDVGTVSLCRSWSKVGLPISPRFQRRATCQYSRVLPRLGVTSATLHGRPCRNFTHKSLGQRKLGAPRESLLLPRFLWTKLMIRVLFISFCLRG